MKGLYYADDIVVVRVAIGGSNLILTLLMKATDVRFNTSMSFIMKRLAKTKMIIREESPPHR
jgi:hypothetical protein